MRSVKVIPGVPLLEGAFMAPFLGGDDQNPIRAGGGPRREEACAMRGCEPARLDRPRV